MVDCWNRTIDYLRLSVTERCQMKCIYCRDKTEQKCQDELTLHDIEKIVRAAGKLGIQKVRLTGGEPLLREDIVDIAGIIKSVPEIKHTAITTNGLLLHKYKEDLIREGIRFFNISLDSMNTDKYREITCNDNLATVKSNVMDLLNTENVKVKINIVLLKEINDKEVKDFIDFTKEHDVQVRFIELMPTLKTNIESNNYLSADSILKSYPELIKVPDNEINSVAEVYRKPGYKGTIGFIKPVSHRFCGSCNRIRVLSNGNLRLCLGDNKEISLKEVIVGGNDELLIKVMREAIYNKPQGHSFYTSDTAIGSMNKIGG